MTRDGPILVTGAAGFVGSWLCARLLDAGLPVVGTARRQPPPQSLFARMGLAQRVDLVTTAEGSPDALLRDLRPAAVFNLAGQADVRTALARPAASFEANAAQAWRLMDAVRLQAPDARVVHVSTDGVYGETGGQPADEDAPLRALGPYEASKAAGDIAARSFAASFGLAVTVARLGNVYGPGDGHRNRLVPATLDALRAGRRPVLRTATATRSYVHVDDVVQALVLLGRHAGDGTVRGRAFNVTSGTVHTTLALAEMAALAAGRPDLAPVLEGQASHEVSMKFSSPDRIHATLGWSAATDLARGLAAVYAHPLETDA